MLKLPENVVKLFNDPTKDLVMANRVFDESALYLKYGLRVKNKVHDILVMSHLLDENSYKYSLESVSTTYTSMRGIKDIADEIYNGETNISEESLITRVGLDSDATLRSFNAIKNKLNEDHKLLNYYLKFVMPTMDMFTDIHFHGCKIDLKSLKESEQEAISIMTDLHNKAIKELPQAIINKHKDKLDIKGDFSKKGITNDALVKDYLFKSKDGLKLKPNKRYLTEKTKEPQNTEEHLKQFKNIPFVEILLEYKEIHTVYTHYIVKFWTYVKPNGYIYPTHHLNRTVTGRAIILDPAMQKIPQRGKYAYLVKRIFVVEDDEIMFARDLSQNEIRVHGWLANDKVILNALNNNIDIHIKTAAVLNKIHISQVTEQQRHDAKGVNFGEIYGQSAWGLQKYLVDKYNIVYTQEECERVITDFFSYPNGYYGVKNYNKRMEESVARKGYIRTFLGRKRHLPDAQIDPTCKEEWSIKRRAQRQAVNFGTQSPSSDMGLIAKFLFNEEIKNNIKFKNKVKPLLFIHDNVMGRCKKDIADKATDLLSECLSERMPEYISKNFKKTLSFPVESDLKTGDSWNNLKEIK